MKIKKGDTVYIISGKDRAKSAKVLAVFPKENKILVEGVSLQKRHQRPIRAGQKGEVVSRPSKIDVSNAMIYCSNCGVGVRAGYKIVNDKKIRICAKCKNEI